MFNDNPQTVSETDVIVIGGGPAGATASTLIAQKGYRWQTGRGCRTGVVVRRILLLAFRRFVWAGVAT